MMKFRVAVIGHTGRGNYGHGLDTVWRELPQCELVGVADPHEGGRAAAAKRLGVRQAFADYRELLDKTKPHIVAICPRWLDQHHDIVTAVAERGAHMYLEKPMCRTLAEADAMVAACEKHQVKLAVAFQTRYSPVLQVVRDVIEDGRLGEVLEYRGRGKEDRRGGGEDLWVLGSHIMNLIHHFAGEPNSCYAEVLQDGKRVQKEHVADGAEGIGPLAGDQLSAMYGCDEGRTAYFASKRNAAGGRFGLKIFGSKGVIDLTTGYLPRASVLFDPSWSPGRSSGKWQPITSAGVGQPEPIEDRGHRLGNIAACQDLIASIEEDREPEANIYEGRTSVEMIAAVFESHRQHRPVELPLENRRNPLTMLK